MDDAAAIRNCRNGDAQAFRYLVEQYQAEAMGHAIAILCNRQDAEDALQEAFLAAYRALGRFDEGRRFYPWFYIILRNCCLKSIASRGRRDTVPFVEILEKGSGGCVEDAIALEDALLELPPESREILTLRHLDGLSYDDLSGRLGIPAGTVMSRLFYARKQLRESLGGRR